MRDARETARCYKPPAIVIGKAHGCAKAADELNGGCRPERQLGIFIESIRATEWKATMGIEAFRTIKKGHFANNPAGVLNRIAFVAALFQNEA